MFVIHFMRMRRFCISLPLNRFNILVMFTPHQIPLILFSNECLSVAAVVTYTHILLCVLRSSSEGYHSQNVCEECVERRNDGKKWTAVAAEGLKIHALWSSSPIPFFYSIHFPHHLYCRQETCSTSEWTSGQPFKHQLDKDHHHRCCNRVLPIYYL